MFLDYFKLSWLGLWGVCFVFIIIYQHNLIIKRNYETQRFVRVRTKLENERNELYRTLLQEHNPETISAHALASGMQPLQLGQVLTCTTAMVPVAFVGTTSHRAVLQTLGLLDLIETRTGRSYARA